MDSGAPLLSDQRRAGARLGQMAGALHQHARASASPPGDAIKSWDARFICGLWMKDALQSFGPGAIELVEEVHLKHRTDP